MCVAPTPACHGDSKGSGVPSEMGRQEGRLQPAEQLWTGIGPQGEAQGILHPAVLRASKAGRSLLLGKTTVQVLDGQVGPEEGAIQLAGVPISESKVKERSPSV